MEGEKDKVILFPKWRVTLEEESLEALKEKRYEEALGKLNELLNYQIHSHEIIIGKLICLMELGRHEEAQVLCEEAMSQKDEDYYHYVHIYLTILFQTNQYSLLMEQVDRELEGSNVPYMMREQFRQLYDVSSKMAKEVNSEESNEYLKELKTAVESQNHENQWRIINRLHQLNATPDKKLYSLLKEEYIHPVIKTALFRWFQDQEVSDLIDVEKLGSQLHVKPIDVIGLKTHPTMKQTMLLISELEQENPTLFQLIKQLLDRYAYVRYPLLPPSEEAVHIAGALRYIGDQMLNIPNETREELNHNQFHYVDEIKMCEQLYLSIIED
ncbi:hypothetical protein SAMN05216389_12129 [Oceanobacillus limi]|uniref:Tetratricopeptide repeat-containing protein n=1 Tax=Oceanobacillus limi TaxID=930131 RepID=A0A1I0GET9_9BACI|nr:tetratricopeptide repeat protein [Oceanobacillus limi]SET69590.1 hypothetical protein SAMN05216389_12129 [Oceanobacillus limi]